VSTQPLRQDLVVRPKAARHASVGLDPLIRAALDGARTGMIVLDRDKVVRLITRNAAQLLGLHPNAGECGARLMRLLAASAAMDDAAIQALSTVFDGVTEDAREIVLSLPAGSFTRVVMLDIRPAARLGWVVSIEDVTQTRQSHDWLLEHVSSDPITGLWNRQHFMLMLLDRLETRDCRGGGDCLALFMIGLQRFRAVNETMGSEAGDAILRLVGQRLRGFLREDDMVARFAGDEFAVAIGASGQDAVSGVSDRLGELLSRPYMIEGHLITLGTTIGVALAPEDGDTADALVASARLALCAAQADATGGFRFFEPKLTDQARRRRGLEADLRAALAREEFELHYQPQVDVRRHVVTGMEALIRWRSPARGLVPPNDFIPLAEEIGLIGPIGDWVLQVACREGTAWPEEISIAVNASPLQFEAGNFAKSVARALEMSGLPPHRLEIEITESLLLRDTGTVVAGLDALHEMGVRLVLDDFGTGYASLIQLSRFRFDKIKIDRSFISGTDATRERSAIVRSIAALGASLGIPTTAEGVETMVQLNQIRADGCCNVQGYYFSRPVPALAVAPLLRELTPAKLAIDCGA